MNEDDKGLDEEELEDDEEEEEPEEDDGDDGFEDDGWINSARNDLTGCAGKGTLTH